MDEQAIIHLEGVSKTYQIESNEVTALHSIDLQISRGAQVALTGRSGSGKSTLLHIIGALDRPSQGRVVVQGVPLQSLGDQKLSEFRGRSVGFVFQMNNLLPEFSALENVMMPALIAGAKPERVEGRAQMLLNAVGMEHRLVHRPSELSGGEQQRVAIARALLMEPPIILADEPTGNLDRKTSLAVQDLLLSLCQTHGITIVLVTHDNELAKRFPQQICLDDGRVVELGGTW